MERPQLNPNSEATAQQAKATWASVMAEATELPRAALEDEFERIFTIGVMLGIGEGMTRVSESWKKFILDGAASSSSPS